MSYSSDYDNCLLITIIGYYTHHIFTQHKLCIVYNLDTNTMIDWFKTPYDKSYRLNGSRDDCQLHTFDNIPSASSDTIYIMPKNQNIIKSLSLVAIAYGWLKNYKKSDAKSLQEGKEIAQSLKDEHKYIVDNRLSRNKYETCYPKLCKDITKKLKA